MTFINWDHFYLFLFSAFVVGCVVYAALAWLAYRKRRSLRGCSQVYGGAIYLGTHRPNYRR